MIKMRSYEREVPRQILINRFLICLLNITEYLDIQSQSLNNEENHIPILEINMKNLQKAHCKQLWIWKNAASYYGSPKLALKLIERCSNPDLPMFNFFVPEINIHRLYLNDFQ